MKVRIAACSALTLALAAPALAQTGTAADAGQQPEVRMRTPAVAPQVGPAQPRIGPAQTVIEAKVTTGRPYSAEATTEFVQVLGDGNRIARKATVRIYRDGEGRTRREELGADDQVKTISIYDPVAHVTYVLDPVTRVATKSAVRIVSPVGRGGFGGAAASEKISAEREASERLAGKMVVAPVDLPSQASAEAQRKIQTEIVARGGGGRGAVQPAMRGPGNAKTESLGQKTIDGVPADGSRTTTVIPAGAIGNQQPITVVAEQWFSLDLEILLLTRHSDPRTGESTYTLSNITRGEPAAGLFDVPSDYTITESSYLRTPALR
jgi:hypothetical protein